MGAAFSEAKNSVVENTSNSISQICTQIPSSNVQTVSCDFESTNCNNSDFTCQDSATQVFICTEGAVASAVDSAVQNLASTTKGGLGIEISKTTNNVTENISNNVMQSCGQQFVAGNNNSQFATLKVTCTNSNADNFIAQNNISQYTNCALQSSLTAASSANQTLTTATSGYDPLASIGLIAGAILAVVVVIVVVVVLVVLVPKGRGGGGGGTVVIQPGQFGGPPAPAAAAPKLRPLPAALPVPQLRPLPTATQK